MKKRLWLVILFIILGFSFVQIDKTKAEGICHINNCFVPAPTIVLPENNSSLSETRPIVRGLTWKRTLIDLYLDGEYQGPVILKEHENHLQSFFWQSSKNLTIGQHYIFTIAYSTKGYDKTIKSWDQSKESTYIYFTVGQEKNVTPAIVLPIEKNAQQLNEQKEIINNSQVINDNEDSDGQDLIADETINNQYQSAFLKNQSNSLFEKNTKDILRAISLVIVGIIILIIIINYLFRKKRKHLTELMKGKLEETDDYPPPPPPISQNNLGI